MKHFAKPLTLALALFAFSAAHAADAGNFATNTTRDLVRLCSVAESNDLHGAAMSYCLGFIDAATDYHAVITSGELLDPIACPKGEVTRGEVLAAFLAWAKSNDALLDGERPIHGLMRAATEKWPCS